MKLVLTMLSLTLGTAALIETVEMMGRATEVMDARLRSGFVTGD